MNQFKEFLKKTFPSLTSAARVALHAWIRIKFSLILFKSIRQLYNNKIIYSIRHERTIQILQPTFYTTNGSKYLSGGAERYLCDLCILIKSLGLKPYILQLGDHFWHKVHDGIDVFGLPTGNSYSLLNKGAHSKLFGKPLLRIFSPFLLGHPHCDRQSIGISHGIFWDHIHANHLIPHIKKSILSVGKLISVDTATLSWFRATIPKPFSNVKSIYIPNYADSTLFYPRNLVCKKGLTILYPRRIYEPRGFFLITPIISNILELDKNISLHFVGQAESDAQHLLIELQQLYPERILHYELTAENMHDAYDAADIVLIPTVRSEGTSLSCLEAMACGKAIIATNVGGLPDLIIDGYNGLLIEPTPAALYNAIEKLVVDEQLRIALGTRSLEVVKSFDKKIWSEKWEKILLDFVQKI